MIAMAARNVRAACSFEMPLGLPGPDHAAMLRASMAMTVRSR
jgi:hypothetical protein